jgi:hypothetical protein
MGTGAIYIPERTYLPERRREAAQHEVASRDTVGRTPSTGTISLGPLR